MILNYKSQLFVAALLALAPAAALAAQKIDPKVFTDTTEGKMMRESHLDTIVAPKAAAMNIDQMKAAFKRGGPQAVVEAGFAQMGVRLPAQAAANVKSVLKETTRDAEKLSANLNMNAEKGAGKATYSKVGGKPAKKTKADPFGGAPAPEPSPSASPSQAADKRKPASVEGRPEPESVRGNGGGAKDPFAGSY